MITCRDLPEAIGLTQNVQNWQEVAANSLRAALEWRLLQELALPTPSAPAWRNQRRSADRDGRQGCAVQGDTAGSNSGPGLASSSRSAE